MDQREKKVVDQLLDLLRELDYKSADLVYEIFPGDGLPGEEQRAELESQAKEIGLRFLRLHGLEQTYPI